MSNAEKDDLVVQLSAEGTIEPDTPEFDALYATLDSSRQMQVDASFRDFANNAIGDEHWDSDD